MEIHFFTDVDDINREILLNIVDKIDVLNACRTNKYATEIYKDDIFWYERIQRIYGFNLSKYTSNGWTYKEIYNILVDGDGDLIKVLVLAVKKVCVPLLRFTIENTVNINIQAINKLIRSASKRGRIDVLKYLLEDSGLINTTIESEYLSFCDTALGCAAHVGNMVTIKYFIEELGTFPLNKNGMELRAAAHMGHLDIVKYLITHRTYTKINKNYGLHAAASGYKTDIVKYFIEEVGADDHVDALMIAIEVCDMRTVKYLIEEIGVRTFDNGVGFARLQGHSELVEYLKNIKE